MPPVTSRKGQVLQDPGFVQWLLNDWRAGFIWLPIRIWLGYQWITASLHKLTGPGAPGWIETGESLKGFWMNAVKVSDKGVGLITYDWYRAFLQALLDAQAYTWFGKLIPIGELLVGIGLIVGGLTVFAAFFGALMNLNFMLAGSASTNPVLFLVAILLIVAWKVAGYVGIDFFLLKGLVLPWVKKSTSQ
jgi:thiosulfate dehydrogenase (quinone) large subunit